MTDSNAKSIVDIYNMDIVQLIELSGIKLYAYQKLFLRIMFGFEKLLRSRRKVVMYDGSGVRCYYGNRKVSKCYNLDERT